MSRLPRESGGSAARLRLECWSNWERRFLSHGPTFASLPPHGVTRGASSLRGSHGRSTRRILRGRHHLPSQVAAATRSCDNTDLISSVMARSHYAPSAFGSMALSGGVSDCNVAGITWPITDHLRVVQCHQNSHSSMRHSHHHYCTIGGASTSTSTRVPAAIATKEGHVS